MHGSENYYQLAIYALLALIVVLVMLSSYFLGERHLERATDEVFESGIKVSKINEGGFPVHFYLIAMFFVVFDIETVFLVAYSLVAKSLGILGLVHLFIFVGFLLLSIFYLYRCGGFFVEGTKKIMDLS